MKLASYNVENLFQRAHAMNLPDTQQAKAREVLTMHAEINGILNKKTYSTADKQRIVALMKKLGIEKRTTAANSSSCARIAVIS